MLATVTRSRGREPMGILGSNLVGLVGVIQTSTYRKILGTICTLAVEALKFGPRACVLVVVSAAAYHEESQHTPGP